MYHSISSWRRRLLHRRAGQALAAQPNQADAGLAAATAVHFEAAGETEQAIAAPATTRTAGEARAHVMGLLQRADVQAEMRALGVDPAEAIERVKAMSDREVQQASGKIDASPAGGSVIGIVLGSILFVFLVLLLTDILCLTSVFPFTKCAGGGKK